MCQAHFALQKVGEFVVDQIELLAAQNKLHRPAYQADVYQQRYNVATTEARMTAYPAQAPSHAHGGSRRSPLNAAPAGTDVRSSGGFLKGPAANAGGSSAAAGRGGSQPPRGGGGGVGGGSNSGSGGSGAAAGRAVKAHAPTETRLAKKRLLDLSYEEYLEVFGRVQEEYWQRRMQEALLKGPKGGTLETENEYVARCRASGRMKNVPDAALRNEYRRMVSESSARDMRSFQ